MLAQLAHFPITGQWQLFIPTGGVAVGEWPTYAFPVGKQLPLTSERDRALKRLGYKRVDPGKVWDWLEHGNAGRPSATTAVVER